MSVRTDVRRRIRGLYGLADAARAEGDPERLGAQLLEGGCRLVQLRCKGWEPDEVLPVARSLAQRCRAVRATILVTDLVEIAVAVGADGVHLGQLDESSNTARARLGPDRILGRSTHDAEQLLRAAAHADYVAFGPVFDTPNVSRPKGVRGLAQLEHVATALGQVVPLVAIGGITVERLPAVRAAGADSWAIIGAIADAADPVAATRAFLPAR